ncbi:MAG: amidophosphoribosyltransferase [Bacteriovoracaceae bacterium]|nr:amidophosphoribosyltransferase [Bacteriovoracaceae bacterium]
MCGIIGVVGPFSAIEKNSSSQASYDVYRGLLTLQHRGQDAAGILSFDQTKKRFHHHKQAGLVANVFDKQKLEKLTGDMAIGHNRYATVGGDSQEDLQPMVTGLSHGVAMAHNGNIINYHSLASSFSDKHHMQLLTTNDVEIILNLWSKYMCETCDNAFDFKKAFKAVSKVFETVLGGYSVIGVVANAGLIAFCDPNGLRPLILGRKKVGENSYAYCVASETIALNFLEYEYVRDVAPGELIFIDLKGKLQSQVAVLPETGRSNCMFEWAYFSAAESTLEGKSVYGVRLELGKLLAKRVRGLIQKKLIAPDIVVPVPDTSRPAAISLAQELGIPYREALIKNRYIHRSFILDSQQKRERMIELKLSPISSEIKGKKILLVDDSIVRGTTAKRIVALLKKHGAKEITLTSACPPIRYPCFYGIDFPDSTKLLASQKEEDEIAQILGVKKVVYLAIKDLIAAIGSDKLCLACLNNSYPTSTSEGENFAKMRCATGD